jgi:hypothetical protein
MGIGDSDAFRKMDSRLKHRVDAALVGFREMYEAMTEDDKTVLKEWLEKFIPIARSPACGQFIGALGVEMKYNLGEDTLVARGVPPLAIKEAMEHWDKGENYAPTTFGELGIA